MNTLSMPMMAGAGLIAALFAGSSAPGQAAKPPSTVSCTPPAAASVPAEYFVYHALVAPHAPLSGRRGAAATCAPAKVIRA
jgi:hypothetical protein